MDYLLVLKTEPLSNAVIVEVCFSIWRERGWEGH